MVDFIQLELFLLVLARITAFLVISPIFALKGVPALVKIGLGLLLSLLIFPGIQPGLEQASVSAPDFTMKIMREVLMGLTLGFVALLVFNSMVMAGKIMDLECGFMMSTLLDPQTGAGVTLLGQFLYVLGLLLFLTLDAHHLLLRLLANSFRLIPLEAAVFSPELTGQIWKIFIDIFSLAFQIATPLLVVLVTSDLVLSLIARSVPQLNVFMIGLPLKAGLGILTLSLLVPFLLTIFSSLLTVMEKDILLVMQLFRP
ncbi:MAG: flagellar biosynthetic protein FliR [Bacillota bacterium]